MNSSTSQFEEIINKNSYLMATMADYFIPKMRYTYMYSSNKKSYNPLRWELTVEESGNVSSLYFLSRGDGWNQKDKTMFKAAYSQFVKFETDLTKTWQLDLNSQLVGHVNAGHIWVYGNSTAAPFSERFYVGGANSIRAFTVRAIGPGRFPGTGSRQMSYLLQNGNTKLVLNLEYRRRLFGSLYGAIFLDAGNVWSSSDLSLDENTAATTAEKAAAHDWNDGLGETHFDLSRLFDQLATGTGIGLRYDLDFLVLRIDWGFGLHVPYKTTKSGYFNIERFKDMHTLHLAIGYPF
jgi:outer membrane protein assembly factor BamA